MKTALLTLNIGDVLGENSRASFQTAARRWGSEYVEVTAADEGMHPHMMKLKAFEISDADRVFYIDADAVISAGCPNPFEAFPEEVFVAVANNQPHMPEPCRDACTDNIARDFRTIKEILGIGGPTQPKLFINAGMWLASRNHHDAVLKLALDISTRCYGKTEWKDQSAINWALMSMATPMLEAEATWNWQYPPDTGEGPMEKFVYHWAGGENRDRIEGVNWRSYRLAGSRAMTYQDIWIKGACESYGERECARRYEIIRRFCSQYRRPFTVLDFGASQCYFGVRLAEDFPDCTVLAVESDHADECVDILRRNDCSRVLLLRRRFSLDDLERLADIEAFDVTLCLSVVHRFPEPWAERLATFRSLGDHLILELPDEPCTGGNIAADSMPFARELGEGESHLVAGHRRKILLFSAMKTRLKKAYLDSPRDDLSMTIYSSFLRKSVIFHHKPERRGWLRGINLQTFLRLGGCWPPRHSILAMIESRREDILRRGHRDINVWNILLAGDHVEFIDAQDPNMEKVMPDSEYFDQLIALAAEEA